MEKAKIGILGCGWLGLPLAERLIQNNFQVRGTTTSLDKVQVLENLGVNPFVVVLNEKNIEGNIEKFLEDVELLIINIPPKLRTLNPESFVGKMKLLIPIIENSNVEKLIFVSSTSVFSDDAGNVDEDTIPEPDSDSGNQLLEVERMLQKSKSFKSTILRFGGLIGGNRNPARTLSGKTNISNPEAPINFINQKDCIKIIETIIDNDIFPKIIHGVAPFHPTRSDFYISECNKLNLPPPEFKFVPTQANKLVQSKLLNEIGYKFIAPEL